MKGGRIIYLRGNTNNRSYIEQLLNLTDQSSSLFFFVFRAIQVISLSSSLLLALFFSLQKRLFCYSSFRQQCTSRTSKIIIMSSRMIHVFRLTLISRLVLEQPMTCIKHSDSFKSRLCPAWPWFSITCAFNFFSSLWRIRTCHFAVKNVAQ